MDLTTALAYCDKAMQDTFAFGQGSLAWLERNDLLTRGKMATYIRRGYTAARSHHDSLLVYGPDSSLQGEKKYKPGSQDLFAKCFTHLSCFKTRTVNESTLPATPIVPGSMKLWDRWCNRLSLRVQRRWYKKSLPRPLGFLSMYGDKAEHNRYCDVPKESVSCRGIILMAQAAPRCFNRL